MRDGPRPGGLKRVWLATANSLRGLRHCYCSEAAFRQEVWLAAVLVPVGLWLGDSGSTRALLVGSMLLVLIVVVDRIGSEHHQLSGFAKDLGSSAVFFSLVLLGATWGLVLLS